IWVCRSPDEDILKPSTPTAAINRLIPLWTFISPFFLPAVLACRPFFLLFSYFGPKEPLPLPGDTNTIGHSWSIVTIQSNYYYYCSSLFATTIEATPRFQSKHLSGISQDPIQTIG